jgi:hypothetical protein
MARKSLEESLNAPLVSDPIEPVRGEERLDERGMRRQTLYLPPKVYEQIRDIAIESRISQQDFFREAIDRAFQARGMPLWEQLEPPRRARRPR